MKREREGERGSETGERDEYLVSTRPVDLATGKSSVN